MKIRRHTRFPENNHGCLKAHNAIVANFCLRNAPNFFSEYAKIQDKFTEGADCQGLASMHCSTMIGGWTVGYSGTCLVNENYAYRIGQNAFRYALVEVPSILHSYIYINSQI